MREIINKGSGVIIAESAGDHVNCPGKMQYRVCPFAGASFQSQPNIIKRGGNKYRAVHEQEQFALKIIRIVFPQIIKRYQGNYQAGTDGCIKIKRIIHTSLPGL
jgi:hypothetical protein